YYKLLGGAAVSALAHEERERKPGSSLFDPPQGRRTRERVESAAEDDPPAHEEPAHAEARAPAQPAQMQNLFAHLADEQAPHPPQLEALQPDNVTRGLEDSGDPHRLLTQAQTRREEIERHTTEGTQHIERHASERQAAVSKQANDATGQQHVDACTP